MNEACAAVDKDNFACVSPPDAKLIADGWERRFIADAARAQEAMEMYNTMGCEVRSEFVNTEELREECSGCLAILKQLRVVYTRKRNVVR
jgi:hypothetical protein